MRGLILMIEIMETAFTWLGIITFSWGITWYGMTPIRHAEREEAKYVERMEKLVAEGKARKVRVNR